ncbi:uncharacterized protein LOC115226848 [Argonauta hians]
MNVKFNTTDLADGISVYANNKPKECSFENRETYYILEKVRRNGCAVKDPTAPYTSYYLIVFIQEDPFIQKATDSKFLLSCIYTSGHINVSSSSEVNIKDTPWEIQDSRWQVVQGYVDMNYELGVYEDDGLFKTPIITANFGDKMALKIEMSGTDQDEKGIRVRQCTAKSGGVEAVFISDFCSTSSLLDKNVGFISNRTTAVLRGLEAFRLAGSEEAVLTFECLLDICSTPCDGINCPFRVRRQVQQNNLPDHNNNNNNNNNRARVFGSWPVRVVKKTQQKIVSSLSAVLLVCIIMIYGLVSPKQRQPIRRRAPIRHHPRRK